jgi:TPR repeat protein
MKGDKAREEACGLITRILNGKLTINQKTTMYNKAISLLRKAAYLGNPLAQFEYALSFYETNTCLTLNNPNYNPKKLVYWYTKASDGDNGEACNSLGYLYETGTGCQKSLLKAIALYKKSAELGCNLGNISYKLMLKQVFKDGIYNRKDKLFLIPQG